jgi:DNA-binding transcriptional LysR family regulator
MSLTPRLVNRLRLKHWSLLSALGETATLNQAALRINVTQPSATKLLSDIEQAFGFALFERHARGMRATPLGAEVVAYARQTQAGLDRFLESLEIKRRAHDGAEHQVADIKRERPRLNVRILGETSDQIGILLDRHEIELAVGRFTDPLQHNKFEFTALADEPLRAVVRRQHELARKRHLSWAELVQWPWVLQTLSSPARLLLEEEFTRAGVSSPADAIECTSIFATLQLVQSSDAISVLPESVVRDHIGARLLVALPLVVGRDLKAFGLLTRKDEPLSDIAQAFAAHLEWHARLQAAPAAAAQRAERRKAPAHR